MDINIKIPQSHEDMEKIYAMLKREEILDDDVLENVVGGNDDLKGKGKIPWTCPACGALIMCKQIQDAAKHMTKCPNNPYK